MNGFYDFDQKISFFVTANFNIAIEKKTLLRVTLYHTFNTWLILICYDITEKLKVSMITSFCLTAIKHDFQQNHLMIIIIRHACLQYRLSSLSTTGESKS